VTSFADYARRYSEIGWALIPVDGKDAYTKAWQKTKAGDPGNVAGKAAEWGRTGKNLGVVLGPSRLAVFEYDNERVRERFLELLGGVLPRTPTCRTGSGKLHVYFGDPGGLRRPRGKGSSFASAATSVWYPRACIPRRVTHTNGLRGTSLGWSRVYLYRPRSGSTSAGMVDGRSSPEAHSEHPP
jgi:bifunctional DNA primase/polymerase-like protein